MQIILICMPAPYQGHKDLDAGPIRDIYSVGAGRLASGTRPASGAPNWLTCPH
jgi:hypothetical protein